MRVSRKRAFTAFASLVLAVVTANWSGAAQAACGTGDPTNLLGTWTLTADASPPGLVVGSNPHGILMLDAACNISFQVMGDRTPHGQHRGQGTAETADEYKKDAQGTIAYYGTYTVDPWSVSANSSLTTLTIKTTRHSFPYLEGKQLSRSITYTAGSGGSPAKLIYKNSSPSTGLSNSGLVFSRQ
jgi:hypothetical protein